MIFTSKFSVVRRLSSLVSPISVVRRPSSVVRRLLHFCGPSSVVSCISFVSRTIPVVCRLSSVVFSLFLLTGCHNNLDEAKLVTSRANTNIEEGKGVVIQYSDHGKTKIKAEAKTVTRFNTQKPYMEFSDGIKVSFYSEDTKVSTTMVADYASAVENSNVMTARKNVEVINIKGEKLNTEELIWDEQKKILYSNAFVKITTADEIIYGNGMEANEDFTDYVIKKITGKVKVKTEKE